MMKKLLFLFIFLLILPIFVYAQEYTPYSSTFYGNNTRSLTLYSGMRYIYEDSAWKPIEEGRSLKGMVNKVYLEKDPDFDISILEINYTYVELELSFNSLNFAKYPECVGSKASDIKCDFKVSIKEDVWDNIALKYEKITTKLQYKYQEMAGVKETLKYAYKGNPFNKEYSFGGNTTTVMLTLNETNYGNIGDANLLSSSPTTNYGSNVDMYVQYTGIYRSIILFNLSLIPSGGTIINATLKLSCFASGGTSPTVSVGNTTTAVWDEATITWNNQPSLSVIQDTIATGSCASRKFIDYNVTNAIIVAHTDEVNASFLLNCTEAGDSQYTYYDTKEYGTVAWRPQLVVYYETVTTTTTLPSVHVGYLHYCIGNYSYENYTYANGTNSSVAIFCNYGCHNDTALRCYADRIPQCDLCQKTSQFYMNIGIIGAFIVTWIILSIFNNFTKKLPLIKYFIWFFVIIAMAVLLFYTPYPTYFTTQQLNIIQIFIMITVMFSVVMLLLNR